MKWGLTGDMSMIEIKHRFTGAVLFTSPGANLRGANLSGAYLRGANLSGAYLRGADLRNADLRNADLSGANLSGANLSGADLRNADLSGAYPRGANLRNADLSDANLRGADLRNANLSGAYLRGANLSGADLRSAIGLSFDFAALRAAAPALRLSVADHIERHPELHDQAYWGDGKADPACGTPCCVAGWACHLGGGDLGLSVMTAATLLLHVDGCPMPDFSAGTPRSEILEALRTMPGTGGEVSP